MNDISKKSFHRAASGAVVLSLLACSLAFAQDQQQNGSPSSPAQRQSSTTAPGWREFQGPHPAPPADPPGPANSSNQNPYQPYGPSNNVQSAPSPALPVNPPDQSNSSNQNPAQPYGASNNLQGPSAPASDSQSPSIPSRLVLRPGAYITVRVDQMLSSNRNQPGDAFTATLEKPLVVDGFVVAARGETVGGQVVEAKKAGRIKGVSQLAVELSNLSLVDGRQAPIHTQFIDRAGRTSKGRDAGTIATTTGLGAAMGAAANGGIGAAVGAGAGVIAGTVGVLLTRGHPTVIYPESELTFRLESPVTVSTVKDPEAFHYVVEDAYAQPNTLQNSAPARPSICNGYGNAYGCPPPFYYGAPYYP
ncbi:MAG: hypothetical protein ACRD3O_15220, partial [Terriglobia bacterium]